MSVHLTPIEVLAGVGALVALGMVWRISARAARRTADAARATVRVVSLAGRVVFTAAVIVGVQWVVITHPGNPVVLWVVLGLPALLAGTWAGLKLYGHLDEASFRKIVLLLLLVSGIALVVPAFAPLLADRP